MSAGPLAHRENAQNALAEIRAWNDELQKFMVDEFNRLDELVDALLAQQASLEQAHRQSEREMLQEQIDKLAQVATELAKTLAEQRRLAGGRVRG
jgi:hypothetical protein